jgi:hypothetical protein
MKFKWIRRLRSPVIRLLTDNQRLAVDDGEGRHHLTL